MYHEAVQAVRTLLARDERVCIVPQNITEFWCVATRREGSANGLGMTIPAAHEEVRRICALLTLLPETDGIYPEWLGLVIAHGVSGIDVYDARLVAAVRVYRIENLLTFDARDFSRYSGIQVFQPKDIFPAGDPSAG
jgi:predicted nucleic acid-binding protein